MGFAAIILAAGESKRMKSFKNKVLHPLAGRPMLHYLVEELEKLSPDCIVIVVNEKTKESIQSSFKHSEKYHFVEQNSPLGTGHAALQARKILNNYKGKIGIFFGDTPFISHKTIQRSFLRMEEMQAFSLVVGFDTAFPVGYGRIVIENEYFLSRIIEERDATEQERQITLCNSGMMFFRNSDVFVILQNIQIHNCQKEYYLTDVIALLHDGGEKNAYIVADEKELLGVNTRVDLANMNDILQKRLREYWMLEGVTFEDPHSVYLSYDTKIGKDTIVGPFTYFGCGVHIEERVCIVGFCYFENSVIQKGSKVGPFVRMRAGVLVGQEVLVGNFVELKNTSVGEASKMAHFTYLGDSIVGKEVNIGAGVITCNYDGFQKQKTHIGDRAFVGTNVSLVAPVKIGNDSVIAAGSVITLDVGELDLAIARSKQMNKSQGALLWRDRKRIKKK